jgi:hypothetical protein
MSDDKKEKKPDLELPELNELDAKSKQTLKIAIFNLTLAFKRILKACFYNDKDKILQLSLAENGKVLVNELNSLMTYLKFKSTKEATLNETLENFDYLDEDKTQIVRDLCHSEAKRLSDTQKLEFYEKVPILTSMDWRFEIEVSSKQRKR